MHPVAKHIDEPARRVVSGVGADRGSIVVGWLTKVVVTLAVVALIAFDLISIVTARLGVTDDANSAAEAANVAWNDTKGNVQSAYNAAAAYAESHGETCPVNYFHISSTGEVHLRLSGSATTFAVGHIGPLKKLATVHGDGDATTPAQ
jgi:hypothetical protein